MEQQQAHRQRNSPWSRVPLHLLSPTSSLPLGARCSSSSSHNANDDQSRPTPPENETKPSTFASPFGFQSLTSLFDQSPGYGRYSRPVRDENPPPSPNKTADDAVQSGLPEKKEDLVDPEDFFEQYAAVNDDAVAVDSTPTAPTPNPAPSPVPNHSPAKSRESRARPPTSSQPKTTPQAKTATQRKTDSSGSAKGQRRPRIRVYASDQQTGDDMLRLSERDRVQEKFFTASNPTPPRPRKAPAIPEALLVKKDIAAGKPSLRSGPRAGNSDLRATPAAPTTTTNPSQPSSASSRSPAKPTKPKLTHLTSTGTAHMVDVGPKPSTRRVAIACAHIGFRNPSPFRLISQARAAKGDVLGTARIAGIMAAKNTSTLIPLCHPIALSKVEVDVRLVAPGERAGASAGEDRHGAVAVQALVECVGPTGVEMEALTAATTGVLTVYDMCKAVDRQMRIGDAAVVYKSGGKSGTHWERAWVEEVGETFFAERGLEVPGSQGKGKTKNERGDGGPEERSAGTSGSADGPQSVNANVAPPAGPRIIWMHSDERRWRQAHRLRNLARSRRRTEVQ